MLHLVFQWDTVRVLTLEILIPVSLGKWLVGQYIKKPRDSSQLFLGNSQVSWLLTITKNPWNLPQNDIQFSQWGTNYLTRVKVFAFPITTVEMWGDVIWLFIVTVGNTSPGN